MTGPGRSSVLSWPEGRSFALSVMDDTDGGVLAKIRPVYDALRYYGLKSTKTIWPMPAVTRDNYWADDLSSDDYRLWLRELLRDGFEVSFHGARSGSSPREITAQALEFFKSEFGEYPATFANHAANLESIYWGLQRFDVNLYRLLYNSLRFGPTVFFGDRADSEYYWADLCRNTVRYVRNFTFRDIVTTAADRYMPYHDPRRPFVRAWFSASEGSDVEEFVSLLSPANIERLAQSGGASIIYTHAAKGFVRDGKLDKRVESIFARLAELRGWYVPVRRTLEELESQRGLHVISGREHAQLETRWVKDHAAKVWRSVRVKIRETKRRRAAANAAATQPAPPPF